MSQPETPAPWSWVPPAEGPPSPWREYGTHAVLFVLTAGTVYLAGGPLLALGLLTILMSHEMGHYIACRYYGVDATLPFFIPAPIGFVGTFGAFIRIRGPIPHRRALFDIGIAGPLAGFVVALPILVLGVFEADLVRSGRSPYAILLGDPLVFAWAVEWLRGPAPEGMTYSLGPLGLAAWVGLFVTALNLMPVGQLDGGHVTYALIRRRATLVSRLGLIGCLFLLYHRPTWLVWCLLLLLLGRRPHPPTVYDGLPVGAARIVVGLVGAVVFALCFTPSPIVFTWSDLLALFTSS
jgi:membrane-associated protease RseP (regulator of RpoE activity)